MAKSKEELKLRAAIRSLVKAEINWSWRGTRLPEEKHDLYLALQKAKKRVDKLVSGFFEVS